MLCQLLKQRGRLVNNRQVIIEEQVAIFLNILVHHQKNQSIQVSYIRLGDMISRYINQILHIILHV